MKREKAGSEIKQSTQSYLVRYSVVRWTSEKRSAGSDIKQSTQSYMVR